MNLTREKAIEAMDVINAAGYTAVIEAAVFRNEPCVLYRVTLQALHYDAVDMRALMEIAESVGLTLRYQLQNFSFVDPADYPPKGIR